MPSRSEARALSLCLAQSAAGIIFGWGVASGSGLFSMPAYQRRFGQCDLHGRCSLDTSRQSAITGLLSAGAIIGAVISGKISDRLGLRRTCIIFVLTHLVGAILETAAFNSYLQIYVARILMGLGIGATSGLVPVFQAEASPPRYRGLATGSFQLCITLGIWGVSVANWMMGKYIDSDASWRVPVGLQALFSLLLLASFLFCPESPRFLAKQRRWRDCGSSLAKLRGLPRDHIDIHRELDKLRQDAEGDKRQGQPGYSECFSRTHRIAWRTMVGVLVQVGQQVTGITFFFSYGVQFAQAAGLADTNVFQILVTSVNVAASFAGLYLIDRAGRRSLLLYGALAMFVCQIAVGSVSQVRPDNATAGTILIAFTCLFVAAFASSWGPAAWVVCAETFPVRLTGLCVTLGTGANWLMSLTIAFVAPRIQAEIGTGICFIWAGCLAAVFTFAFLCIPETRGMSMEQVDIMYRSHTAAWQSYAPVSVVEPESYDALETSLATLSYVTPQRPHESANKDGGVNDDTAKGASAPKTAFGI